MSTSSMGEGVIELGQVEGPLDLTVVQRLGCSEVHEVSVVIQDLNCVFTVVPSSMCLHSSSQGMTDSNSLS